MFHVNPQTGEPGKCTAQVGNCPFGGANVHYFNQTAAREAFESSQAALLVPKPAAKPASSTPDLITYATAIARTRDPEVYVHPQGKVAIVNDDGSLSIFKNGLPAKSSGTLGQLRAGRGAWKSVPYDELPGKKKNPLPPTAAFSAEDRRKQVLVANGMPATSTLDPTKTGKLQEGKVVTDYRRGASGRYVPSILPVDERFNPHSGISNSEWIPEWGSPGQPSAVEVWKASPTRYKLVATSGADVQKLGSKTSFQHDQTGSRMGDDWVMVGAFEGEDGGQVIGEVPDRKMPLYTYK